MIALLKLFFVRFAAAALFGGIMLAAAVMATWTVLKVRALFDERRNGDTAGRISNGQGNLSMPEFDLHAGDRADFGLLR